MISRYTLPKMGNIWSEKTKFQKMLDVEIAACEAMSRKGKIPKSAFNKIKNKAKLAIKKTKKGLSVRKPLYLLNLSITI